MTAGSEKKAASGSEKTNDALNRTIERAKQELEHMIDLNPQIMLLVNRSGVVVRTNKALLDLLHYHDYSEALGKRLEDMFPCKDMVFFSRLIDDPSGACEPRDATITLNDGTTRMLRFTGVGSGAGKDLNVIIIGDATAEKEQAARTEKRYKKEAVQNLMGALMHNINQPLTVIMVKSQLMHLGIEKGNVKPADMSRDLQDIMKLTMHIADTLESLEKPRDFVTKPYFGSMQIMDLNRSANRYDRWESFCMSALERIIRAADAHDPWASAHAAHTGEYAAILARGMKLGERDIMTAQRCGILHDIGKIGIPDSILQKPAPLDEAERTVMNTHAEIGYDLLRSLPFLAEEADAAYAHHERHDGSGYPRQIAGDDIPLMARIVAVADSFDALRFNRPYRAAIPLDKVVKMITVDSAKQFNPEVLKAFSRCQREFEAVNRA
jgi:putative nucleotidyltransferase with HDIG domain